MTDIAKRRKSGALARAVEKEELTARTDMRFGRNLGKVPGLRGGRSKKARY